MPRETVRLLYCVAQKKGAYVFQLHRTAASKMDPLGWMSNLLFGLFTSSEEACYFQSEKEDGARQGIKRLFPLRR